MKVLKKWMEKLKCAFKSDEKSFEVPIRRIKKRSSKNTNCIPKHVMVNSRIVIYRS